MWSQSGKKKDLFEWLENPSMELDVLVGFDNASISTVVESRISKPVQVIEKKPVELPKRSPKSFSIKQVLEGKPSEVDTPNESVVIADEDHFDEGEEYTELEVEEYVLTQIDIEKYWQKFIDAHLSGKPRYSSMLTTYSPVLEGNNMIVTALESQLQVDMFNEIKNDLTVFLRSKLGCKTIELSTKIIESTSAVAKMYTTEDKLKFLSESNPNILDLKQQLHLDFD